MTGDRIKELALIAPDDLYPEGALPVGEYEGAKMSNRSNELYTFTTAYKDPAFVWNYVKYHAERGLPLPTMMDDMEEEDKDGWSFLGAVDRAYFFEMYPNRKDRIMSEVLSLLLPSMTNERKILNAMLLVNDATLDDISELTGYNLDTVKTYEKLCFNVLDRKKEHLWITNLVYPDTLMVELYDGYNENEEFGNLLIRSAYKNGINDVMFFAGFQQNINLIEEMVSDDMPSRLEKVMMANAVLLSRNGWLNQASRSAPGLSRTSNMIAAAKQSGEGMGEDSEGLPGAGETLLKEITKLTNNSTTDYIDAQFVETVS
jgi:hypothetical protein